MSGSELPLAPGFCALDADGFAAQRARYAEVAAGAVRVERNEDRVSAQLGDAVGDDVVAELIAVERECCPFFELEWDPGSRRLTVGVGDPAHRPALDAIQHALTG